jgi:hypothetical protein
LPLKGLGARRTCPARYSLPAILMPVNPKASRVGWGLAPVFTSGNATQRFACFAPTSVVLELGLINELISTGEFSTRNLGIWTGQRRSECAYRSGICHVRHAETNSIVGRHLSGRGIGVGEGAAKNRGLRILVNLRLEKLVRGQKGDSGDL